MSQCNISTPIGIAKIVGDDSGISSVTVLNSEEKVTDIIPDELEDCVIQLREYFEGDRKQFDLNLNPEGTDFQKQVWKLLEQIPYGKTISYLDLSKQ